MTPTAPNPTSADQVVCSNPACGASNRAGTRFCASCGTAITATSPQVPPQMPPPVQPPFSPPVPPMPRPGYGASSYGPLTMDKTAEVHMAPEWAYNHLSQALQTMGATIDMPNPPVGLNATIAYKSLGSPLRFRCQAALQPNGPASTRISFGIKVEWGSTFLMLGILGGMALLNVMFLTAWLGIIAPLLSAVALGWAVYDYATGIPNRLSNQLQKALASAPVAPPSVATPAPARPNLTKVPVPSAQPAMPVNADAVSAETDIIAKIEKLAALKDKGLISEAEFDKRRSELLDRL